MNSWTGQAMPAALRSGVGNAAADQHQLDGYVWVSDVVLAADPGPDITSTRDVADHVWLRGTRSRGLLREPDAGIWGKCVTTRRTTCTPRRRPGSINPRCTAHRRTPSDRAKNGRGGWRSRARGGPRRDPLMQASSGTVRTYTSSTGPPADRRRTLRSSASAWTSTRPGPHRVRVTIDAITDDLDALGAPSLYRYPVGHDGLAGAEEGGLPAVSFFLLVSGAVQSGRLAEA